MLSVYAADAVADDHDFVSAIAVALLLLSLAFAGIATVRHAARVENVCNGDGSMGGCRRAGTEAHCCRC